jgi:hypothetical protein
MTMQKLTRADLLSLEQYAEQRPAFRDKVLAHKRHRRVHLGEHAALYFEDRLTMQYQIQEMLRVERIFEPQAIEEELAAYNPLIPDGTNLKATFMLEYADVAKRREALQTLAGIEHKVWIAVNGQEKVWAAADEDMERGDEDKTSAVHFLRFEFTAAMIAALQEGAPLTMGIDHPGYQVVVEVSQAVRDTLANDFAA